MTRPWTSVSLILLLLAAGGCSQNSSGTDTFAPSPVAALNSEVIPVVADLTNAERAHAGLAPLAVNSRLNTAAQLQADQVAAARTLEHTVGGGPYPTPPDRLAAAGYEWQAYAENLASGYRTAAEATNSWMNSPGHRTNILNPEFTELGTAYAADSTGRPYYVQVFGRPR